MLRYVALVCCLYLVSGRSYPNRRSTRSLIQVVRNAVQSGVDKAFDVTESIISSDLGALKVNIERSGYKSDKQMEGIYI